MRLREPTLTRRVVLALLMALTLTWCVLLTFLYFEVRYQERNNPQLEEAATQLAEAIGPLTDPQKVEITAFAIERMIIGSLKRHGDPTTLLVQIQDTKSRQIIYASPTLAGTLLEGLVNRQMKQTINSVSYDVFARQTPAWIVQVAQSRIRGDWLLRSLVGDLTKYMLVALPFILLPVWLAVRRGLQPLRQFSAHIAARGTSDLSALGVAPKHAELKPISAALDALLARVSNQLQRERAFVQDAAHELRTPIAVIAAQAHVLAKAQGDDDRTSASRSLQAAVDRASHLIRQLLVLSRMEADRRSERNLNDLAAICRQVLSELNTLAAEEQIELVFEGPDRYEVCVDRNAFESVLRNLVDNAIRYGRQGGRVLVEISAQSQGWRLAVADDGPGIAVEERVRVFDRFYRGVGHDTTGTGLGLAIVAQAATQLQAQITLANGLDGKGCRFTLEHQITGPKT